ncbi:UNVERIFIED_CONTAM: hypothetical protein K2H54_054234 [Gekko kuhli]
MGSHVTAVPERRHPWLIASLLKYIYMYILTLQEYSSTLNKEVNRNLDKYKWQLVGITCETRYIQLSKSWERKKKCSTHHCSSHNPKSRECVSGALCLMRFMCVPYLKNRDYGATQVREIPPVTNFIHCSTEFLCFESQHHHQCWSHCVPERVISLATVKAKDDPKTAEVINYSPD